MPQLVRGPCLLNVVHGGKTPAIDLSEAERMGYKLAIVPGLLIKNSSASANRCSANWPRPAATRSRCAR